MPSAPSEAPAKKSARDWNTLLVTPLLLFAVLGGWTSNMGSQAKSLEVPWAGFIENPFVWMVLFVLASLFIPSRKLSNAACLMGYACVALSFLLVFIYTKTVPVSRWLTPSEQEEMRRQCDIPIQQSSGDGHRIIRIRRSDDSEALRAYLQKLGVLLPEQ